MFAREDSMFCLSVRRYLLPGFLLPGCLAAAVCLNAQAQGVPPKPVQAETKNVRADPLDAMAEVAPALHQSAFAFYRAVGDASVAGWREANDTVTRIGGWRAYARETQAPAPLAGPMVTPTVPTPAASANTGVHQSHRQP